LLEDYGMDGPQRVGDPSEVDEEKFSSPTKRIRVSDGPSNKRQRATDGSALTADEHTRRSKQSRSDGQAVVQPDAMGRKRALINDSDSKMASGELNDEFPVEATGPRQRRRKHSHTTAVDGADAAGAGSGNGTAATAFLERALLAQMDVELLQSQQLDRLLNSWEQDPYVQTLLQPAPGDQHSDDALVHDMTF